MSTNVGAKLNQKYYGPYHILEKFGNVAYKLQLPLTSRLHHVFLVSLLKTKIGDLSLIREELPTIGDPGSLGVQEAHMG